VTEAARGARASSTKGPASIVPIADLVVADHRLVRRLGSGGTGTVWEAEPLPDGASSGGPSVAIKFLAPEVLAAQPELADRMRREWEACRRIQSPRVVKVLAHGMHGDTPYLMMELVRGETLFDVVKRGPLELEQVHQIVTEVGEALTAAHAAGVIHRDIKPGNVMLTPSGVKILDFGFAKLNEAATLITQEGMSLGSPTYMSPEQFLGSSTVDQRTDLWALAVVAYFALTGGAPFTGLKFIDIAKSVLGHDFDPVSHHRDLGPEVDAFFARAFTGPIVARFQSAEEMADAFARLVPPSSRSGAPVVSGVRRLETADVVPLDAAWPTIAWGIAIAAAAVAAVVLGAVALT